MTDKLLREFKDGLGAVRLVPGDSGAFEISINGQLAYSKAGTGRFPTIQEIRLLIKAAS